MQMIPLVVGGVLILAGFVALYLSRDNWRAYHIVLVLFLLLANVAFFYLAARTLDTHRAWRGEVAKFERAYAQEYAKKKLLTGELDGTGEVIVDRDEKAEQNVPWTIDDWSNELAEAGYGRGRMLATVGMPKLNPETGGMLAVATEPVTLAKDTLVYVFQSQPPSERQIPYKGTKDEVPVTITSPPIVRYLGAYVVASVNAREVELLPLYPELRPDVKGPLMIFELAPVDTHEAFAHVPPDVIKKLLPSPPVPPEVVQQYLFDGKPIDPKAAPPEIVAAAWRRVKFVKEHTLKDPDAKPAAAPEPPPVGDAVAAEPAAEAGEAPDPLASGELKFLPDDEALFDPQTAEELVNKKVAEYVQPGEGIATHVYMRPLHNYPAAFRNLRTELISTQLTIAELDRQIAAIQESIKLAQQSEQVRKEEAARRAQDLERFTFEAETMQKLHDAFVHSVKQATAEVASLKQSIASQAEQLTRLQFQAAQASSQRAAPVTAASAR